MFRRRNVRRSSTVSADVSTPDRAHEHSITCGLLMVSFCYIFITSVGSVNMYILNSYIQPRIAGDKTHTWAKRAKLITYIVQWGAIINLSVNFFLYILGSHAFRNEFLRMLRQKKGNTWTRGKPGAIEPPLSNCHHSMVSEVRHGNRRNVNSTQQRKSITVTKPTFTSV